MATWQATRTSSRRAHNVGGDERLATTLLQIVDLGLWSIVFIGPHLFGGRHPLGHFAILSICVLTAFTWFARQLWIKKSPGFSTPAVWLFAVATAWVAFQLVPLPHEWLSQLAPRIYEILPLWNGPNASVPSLGTWQTVSLCPAETRSSLATLMAYGLLFITTVQRLETVEDIKRIVRWIGISATIVACFGIVLYFTANGKFFWFYDYPFVDTKDSFKAGFTSRNHFAHFLVLGLSALVASTVLLRNPVREVHTVSRQRRNSLGTSEGHHSSCLVLTVAAVIVTFAILASLSRGGLLALTASGVVLTLIYAKAGLLNSGHALSAGLLIIVVVVALSITGTYDKLAQRVDSLSSTSLEVVDSGGGRRSIWQANLAAFRASWLTGSGAGTQQYIYPIYIDRYFPTLFTHAENGYLQVASENGLPGVLLLVTALLIVFSWGIRTVFTHTRNTQIQILTGGVFAALIASVVHSIVDFVWFIPACATVTILLVGCMSRLWQLSNEQTAYRSHQRSFSQLSNFNMTLGTGVAALWIVMTLFPSAKSSLTWDTYTRARLGNESIARQKTAGWQHLRDELEEAERMNAAIELQSLQKIVRECPSSATAHAQLACALLKQFETACHENGNAMALSQVREAAQASNFRSKHELRSWLKVAFGESSQLLYQAYVHAHSAIKLCPLQAEAYICLAELCFLEGHGMNTYYAYAEQGLRVNPLNPMHLFGIGKNYFIADDREQAMKLWRTAFAANGIHQQYIALILVQELTAQGFLHEFKPDLSAMEMLWQAYEANGSLQDQQAIMRYAAQETMRVTPSLVPEFACKAWNTLADMQLKLNDLHAAYQSLQQAYKAYPNSIDVRRKLGKCLIAFGQFDAAEHHLYWCTQQLPNHHPVQLELQQATRGKMQRLAKTLQTPPK